MNKAFLLIKSYFPTKLPVGMTEFATWSDDVITLVGPIADALSLRFALATQIMHADSSNSALPMQYFIKRLRKTAANQVAAQVFQDVKLAQKKAAEEAAKNQTPEVTVTEGIELHVPEIQQN